MKVITEKTKAGFEKFGELCVQHYSNRINRFKAKSPFPEVPIDAKERFIDCLVNRIDNFDIMELDNGVTIDFQEEDIPVMSMLTHALSAYTLKGKKGLPNHPYIDKWTPLVMWVIKEKTGIDYSDFWLIDNPRAKYLLGRDLKDLTVPIRKGTLDNLTTNSSHIINESGHKIKVGNINLPDDEINEETVELLNNPATRILRNWSTRVCVHKDHYPKNASSFEDSFFFHQDIMVRLDYKHTLENER